MKIIFGWTGLDKLSQDKTVSNSAEKACTKWQNNCSKVKTVTDSQTKAPLSIGSTPGFSSPRPCSKLIVGLYSMQQNFRIRQRWRIGWRIWRRKMFISLTSRLGRMPVCDVVITHQAYKVLNLQASQLSQVDHVGLRRLFWWQSFKINVINISAIWDRK